MTTSQVISEDRLIRVVDDKIAYYDPEAAPLITMLNQVKRRKGVPSTHCEWYEKDYPARWMAAAETIDNVATSLDVDVGTRVVPGDTFLAAPAEGAFGRTEMCLVTARTGNTLTIVRNIGGNNAGAITSGQDLRILGGMYEEFSQFPEQKRAIPEQKDTYLQIDRTPTIYSNTAIAVGTYASGGRSEREQAHFEDMVQHKQKMNATLIWGKKSQDLSGGPQGNPRRSTMGLVDTIQTNVQDVGGMLTWKKFQTWSRALFRYGPKRKVMVSAPIILEAIDAFGKSHMTVTDTTTSFGLNIKVAKTSHGELNIVRDWMLESGPSGNYGFGGIGIAMNMDEITYLYLSNHGVNRDTKVERDVIKNGADGKHDQIITEYGFKIRKEFEHGILANVTDYMS